MKTTVVLALAAAAAILPATAHAATVIGGTFETPVVSPNPPNYATTTMFNASSGIEANGGQFGYAPAPEGTQIAHIQNGGTVTLDVTGLTGGTDYFAQFFTAARRTYLNLPLTVSFNGITIGTITPTSTAFTAVPFRFSATGTSGTLLFSGAGPAGDLNAAIDNVTVAAVPEAATWAMMLAGFGMIGTGVRSRKRSTATLAHA